MFLRSTSSEKKSNEGGGVGWGRIFSKGLEGQVRVHRSDDGFSYIPYKNLSPVIGGISKKSSYYKSIKRQLGFISYEINTSIYFEKNNAHVG